MHSTFLLALLCGITIAVIEDDFETSTTPISFINDLIFTGPKVTTRDGFVFAAGGVYAW